MTPRRIVSCSLALFALGLHSAGADAPWTTHATPDGFAVSAPSDWTISTQSGSRIVVQDADHRELAIVQPFAAKTKNSKAWLGAWLPKMSALLPHAAIAQSHAVKGEPDETAASVIYEAPGGSGRADILCSVTGGHGMLFAIAAPKDTFAASQPTLLKVVNSFHVAPASGAAGDGMMGDAPAGVSFVTWKDPKEAAFTNQVPRGWTVSGGLYRFNKTDTRPQLDAISPDGQTHIRLGDSTMPMFTLPTPTLQMHGIVPGSFNTLPSGLKVLVLPYRTGADLSRDIVQNQWGRRLQNVQITTTEELPAPTAPVGVPGAEMTKGITKFTFEQNGQTMIGFVRTATLLIPFSNGLPGGSWFCMENGEGLGPDGPGQEEQLEALVTQVQTSRKWSPTWTAANSKAVAAQTQQFTKPAPVIARRGAVTSPESHMSHAEFMEWMREQQRRRNLQFKVHMLRKDIDHANFMHSEFPDQY